MPTQSIEESIVAAEEAMLLAVKSKADNLPPAKVNSGVNYTILNSDFCTNEMELLIWVYSAPSNFQQRKAVRLNWGRSKLFAPIRTGIVFSLAVTRDNRIQQDIVSEMNKYGDIVQDGGFIDAYRNLTYKVV